MLAPPPSPPEAVVEAPVELLGTVKATLSTRMTDHLIAAHEAKLKGRMKGINWELFDHAVGATNWSAIEELIRLGGERKLTLRAGEPKELRDLRAALDKPFAERLFLWRKPKKDLVDEMGTALQVPGWGNIFTQPIINRIEMLATGVRTQIGVKVLGSDQGEIQRVSQEEVALAAAARPGRPG